MPSRRQHHPRADAGSLARHPRGHAARQDYEIVLQRGDVMVLYTDGIIEARDAQGRLFEMERLCAAVQMNYRGSVAEIRDGIMTRVRAFMHEQEDDMTLLVFRYCG